MAAIINQTEVRNDFEYAQEVPITSIYTRELPFWTDPSLKYLRSWYNIGSSVYVLVKHFEPFYLLADLFYNDLNDYSSYAE